MMSVFAALPACTGRAVTATPSLASTATAEPTAATGIEIQDDVEYTSTQLLDIHTPGLGKDWPIVVILHGLDGEIGVYSQGASEIAESGAVVYNANWRSIPWEYGVMAMMEDAACAVRFARSTAFENRGDPDRVILFGHSIGGWSGAVVALNGDSFAGDCLAKDVSAVPGASYLREENPELWAAIYPLVVGENDIAFMDVAVKFHEALSKEGYQAKLNVLEGEGHNIRYPSRAFDRLIEIIVSATEP